MGEIGPVGAPNSGVTLFPSIGATVTLDHIYFHQLGRSWVES